MAATEDLAKLKNPTAQQTLAIFEKHGLPLSVSEDGRLIGPKGIPNDMAALLTKHEGELIRLLTTDARPAKVPNRHGPDTAAD